MQLRGYVLLLAFLGSSQVVDTPLRHFRHLHDFLRFLWIPSVSRKASLEMVLCDFQFGIDAVHYHLQTLLIEHMKVDRNLFVMSRIPFFDQDLPPRGHHCFPSGEEEHLLPEESSLHHFDKVVKRCKDALFVHMPFVKFQPVFAELVKQIGVLLQTGLERAKVMQFVFTIVRNLGFGWLFLLLWLVSFHFQLVKGIVEFVSLVGVACPPAHSSHYN